MKRGAFLAAGSARPADNKESLSGTILEPAEIWRNETTQGQLKIQDKSAGGSS